jgi:hypothetical protein
MIGRSPYYLGLTTLDSETSVNVIAAAPEMDRQARRGDVRLTRDTAPLG